MGPLEMKSLFVFDQHKTYTWLQVLLLLSSKKYSFTKSLQYDHKIIVGEF